MIIASTIAYSGAILLVAGAIVVHSSPNGSAAGPRAVRAAAGRLGAAGPGLRAGIGSPAPAFPASWRSRSPPSA